MKNLLVELFQENKIDSKSVELIKFIKEYVDHLGYPDNSVGLIDDIAEKICQKDDCFDDLKSNLDINIKSNLKNVEDETQVILKYKGYVVLEISCMPEYEDCSIKSISSDFFTEIIKRYS